MGLCCCDSDRAKQKSHAQLIKEANLELLQPDSIECRMTDMCEETRDSVILDLECNSSDENFFQQKHTRRKTFSHFDNSLSPVDS